MADTWITDLAHFLDNGRIHPNLSGPARSLVNHLGAIVAAVTGGDPEEPLGVPCRRRPGRRPCPGEIDGFIDPESNKIHWLCPICGDNGSISNWEGMLWDCRAAGVEPLQ